MHEDFIFQNNSKSFFHHPKLLTCFSFICSVWEEDEMGILSIATSSKHHLASDLKVRKKYI